MFKYRLTISASCFPSPTVRPPICLLDYFPKPIFCKSFGQIVFELDTDIKYNDTSLVNKSVMFTFDTKNYICQYCSAYDHFQANKYVNALKDVTRHLLKHLHICLLEIDHIQNNVKKYIFVSKVNIIDLLVYI